MRRAVVAAGLAGVLGLASVFLLHERGPRDARPDGAPPADAVPIPAGNIATEADAVAARSDALREPAAIDLRDASETFRNSTLLFAIRRAGFYCADVISAHESVEGVWVAGCSDVVNYIVTLRGTEQFDVHPVPYGDSVAPFPLREIPRDPTRIDPGRSVEPRFLEPPLR
jgi:hypothetical protein